MHDGERRRDPGTRSHVGSYVLHTASGRARRRRFDCLLGRFADQLLIVVLGGNCGPLNGVTFLHRLEESGKDQDDGT